MADGQEYLPAKPHYLGIGTVLDEGAVVISNVFDRGGRPHVMVAFDIGAPPADSARCEARPVCELMIDMWHPVSRLHAGAHLTGGPDEVVRDDETIVAVTGAYWPRSRAEKQSERWAYQRDCERHDLVLRRMAAFDPTVDADVAVAAVLFREEVVGG